MLNIQKLGKEALSGVRCNIYSVRLCLPGFDSTLEFDASSM